MSSSNVILVGGPDTGKTNFIGRLWIALQTGNSAISTSGVPEEIEYVEDVVAHLHQGRFAPRTEQKPEVEQGSVTIPLDVRNSGGTVETSLCIPDVSGEVWKKAVETNELPPGWMARLEGAFAALLFVRVLSATNASPTDWVNEPKLMRHQEQGQQDVVPTQVMLCELLRFLELKLADRPAGRRPRVAVVVTAWDLLDEDRSCAGPRAYLQEEYPLFAGRLSDVDRCEVMVFAVSILGGDPVGDEGFREGLLDSGFDRAGYVRFDNDGEVRENHDVSLPVAWATGAWAIR